VDRGEQRGSGSDRNRTELGLGRFDRGRLLADPHWAAFSAGVLFDHLRWCLLQLAQLGEPELRDEARGLLARLRPKLLALTPAGSDTALGARLAGAVDDFLGYTTTESYAEQANADLAYYHDKALGRDDDEDSSQVGRNARWVEDEVRKVILEAIGGRVQLKDAFLLGQTVD
jgi:hypothetical protein